MPAMSTRVLFIFALHQDSRKDSSENLMFSLDLESGLMLDEMFVRHAKGDVKGCDAIITKKLISKLNLCEFLIVAAA